MHRMVVAGLALALVACGPKAEDAQAPEKAATAAGCAAEAAVDWAPANAGVYRIAAAASGATCDAGQATITITDAAGAVRFTGTFDVAPMTSTVFAEAKTPETLMAALAAWIDPMMNGADTTATLPAWAAGAETPMSGEFPFYPADGLTRDAYTRLVGQGRPMYCFVQGGESQKCLSLGADGALTEVGLQTFPG